MKKYLIDFRIYEQTWSDSFGRTCPDCVNEDNVEAWIRYVSAKISELMKDDHGTPSCDILLHRCLP